MARKANPQWPVTILAFAVSAACLFTSVPTAGAEAQVSSKVRAAQKRRVDGVRQLAESAAGLSPASADDDIPGVSLPPATVTDSLDEQSDWADVYSLQLDEGDSLMVTLTAAADSDFDLALYGPDAQSVQYDLPISGAMSEAYPEEFTHTVYIGRAGVHYLTVSAYYGTGDYTLTYSVIPGDPSMSPDGVPVARADGRELDVHRFPPPVNEYNQYFGYSVALSEDTMVIGRAANSAPGVHIARKVGDGWGALEALPASPADRGNLGRSVAIDGDYIVAGAPNENRVYAWRRTGSEWVADGSVTDAGASYLGTDVAIEGNVMVAGGGGRFVIYSRASGSWQPVQSFKTGGFTGCSVDIQRDTIVVGDSAANVVRVYRKSDSTWSLTETLQDTGWSRVSLDGDTLAVGTMGSVLVYERWGGRWLLYDILYPSVPYDDEANSFLGYGVMVDGDRIVAGAPHDDEWRTAGGAAYVFSRTESGWVEGLRYAPPSGGSAGEDVAICGEWIAASSAWDEQGGAAYAIPLDVPIVVVGDHLVPSTAPGILLNDSGGHLSAELVSGATYGEVDLAPDGSFTYSSSQLRTGRDSFTYRLWNGNAYSDPVTARFSVVAAKHEYTQVAGTSRFLTSVAVSREAFPDGADTVIIATGRNWPDALGGASLAGAVGGPILLSDTDSIPLEVRSEIARLGATKAIILGAQGALGSTVEGQLWQLGLEDVYRIGGADRYETAAMIAEETVAYLGEDWDGTAMVATGAGFADALAASPVAAYSGWPIFLADPRDETAGLEALLLDSGVRAAVVLGGSAAVPDARLAALDEALPDGALRLAGTNRYATAARIGEFGVDVVGMSWDGAGIAAGTNFPDGLAGGVLCGLDGSVMLLTDGSTLSPATRDALVAHRSEILWIRYLGGTAAVNSSVRSAVASTQR